MYFVIVHKKPTLSRYDLTRDVMVSRLATAVVDDMIDPRSGQRYDNTIDIRILFICTQLQK